MDCRQALAQLDLTTLGRDTTAAPDVVAARRHVAECPACQLAFQSQQGFDREVSRAMSDVPVPDGLAQRLTAAVCPETALPETGRVGKLLKSTTASNIRYPLKWLSVGLAGVLLVGLLIMGTQSRSMLTKSSVGDLAKVNLNALPFDSQQAFPLPTGWNSSREVQFGDSPRLAPINGVQVPVQAFLLRLDREPAATGILARIQPSQWQPAPEATSFSSAMIQYAPFGAWVVWQEGDAVFVCILQGDPQAMQRFQKRVAGNRKFT